MTHDKLTKEEKEVIWKVLLEAIEGLPVDFTSQELEIAESLFKELTIEMGS